jgi:hypothetical protein
VNKNTRIHNRAGCGGDCGENGDEPFSVGDVHATRCLDTADYDKYAVDSHQGNGKVPFPAFKSGTDQSELILLRTPFKRNPAKF